MSTDWDVAALCWAYQRGLANHIKDELVHIPEQRDLFAFRNAVLQIDNWYWRREEDKKRDSNRNPTPSRSTGAGKKGNNSGPSNTSTSSSSDSSNQTGQQSKPWSGKKNNNKNWKGNSGALQSSGQSASTSSSKLPKPHAKSLGPDRKVKPDELE